MDNIRFSLTYRALKMFGRQLYSNAWSAISELVANGFDAGAGNVYLYIDMRDKSRSTVELIDNGSGMNEQDIRNKYVIIGRNRRQDDDQDVATGRKGIGKLAALYLSDKYNIITKKDSNVTAYSVDVSNLDDDSVPELVEIQKEEVSIFCSDIWSKETRDSGTIIQLHNVDLSRLGDIALESLKHKLSNYFLYSNMAKQLEVCIIKDTSDKYEFKPVEKKIAFDNMASIYYTDSSLLDCQKDDYSVQYYNKLGQLVTVNYPREIKVFPETITDAKTKQVFPLSGKIHLNGKEKEYALKGWIGIHSTIEQQPAQGNDNRYIKNQFYNPNQIRIYVRNKLASENVISRLGLTAQYANYLEGELSFDILDDSDLEDIATANRQDFSVEDERVKLMLYLIRGLARHLLNDRQELADKINALKRKGDDQIRSKEKTQFAQSIKQDLVSANVSEDIADQIAPIIGNKLKGEYELKTSYKLFVSHSKKDRIFTDFITKYLCHRGFSLTEDPDTTDIFYSSDGLDITSLDPLSVVIKDMIVNHNTDILFFTSKNFLQSQFCLFEGGAAWATRSIVDYSIISIDYKNIPTFLTNGKPEFTFESDNPSSFELNSQNYKNIITILNRAIKHLNNNKRIQGKPEVQLIEEIEIPDKVQLQKLGKKMEDYFDADVYAYWQEYVIKQLDVYLQDNE